MGRLSRRTLLRRASLAALAPYLAHHMEGVSRVDATLPGPRIMDLWPDRATYRPGAPATLHLTLANQTGGPLKARLALRLSWLDEARHSEVRPLEAPPGTHTLDLPLTLPADAFRGYGVDITLQDREGRVLDQAATALDVLDDWTQAPRYGFLADFAPDDPFAAESVAQLARYHVNVVQFYDWMWRHYALMPPTDDFTDALGRALSLSTVRAKVAACGAHGMAALGYAAVYGAEPEYALSHPDEMLYNADGVPYSLEQLFYIMNIHKGNTWRARILAEMARAVREVPFDGLHLDQYGFPKDQAFGPPPRHTPINLAEDIPTFIDDARAAIRAARPDTRVIFNAVGNWPIETVAHSDQDATYIEVWPPFETYSDLQTLILEARRLAPTKQVILAAYLAPLLGAVGDALTPAEHATRLASAAIWANGGFHLLLGERDGALCDPYYPKYATLMPDFAHVMRRYYDFVVRYENMLSDPRLVTAAGTDGLAAVRVQGEPATPFGDAGTVWTVARAMPGLRTVSLINLTAATDANWNAAKPAPPVLRDLEVAIRVEGEVRGIFAASPDDAVIAAQSLPFRLSEQDGARWAQMRLPRLEYWSLVVVKEHA